MALLKQKPAKSLSNVTRSKPDVKKAIIVKRKNSVPESSFEEPTKSKAAGVECASMEKRLKRLEEKLPELIEEIGKNKVNCTDLDSRLKECQQELDITKKAYAELIFYELNKGNTLFKMNSNFKEDINVLQETPPAQGNPSKIKTEEKKEKLKKLVIPKRNRLTKLTLEP